ncbi:MAG: DUF3320 domain-containing protein [Candidatus Sumerlaeia bacterium]
MEDTAANQEACSEATPATGADTPCRLTLELEADPTINLAMQQNDVPVIKALRVKNDGGEAVGGVDIRIWSEPAFTAPWSGRIDTIAAGSTYNLANVGLDLSAQFLLDLTERLAGTLRVEAATGAGAPATLGRRIDILAPDEWSGLRSLPEILAAFVLPNHPAIEPILAGAASVLEGWTGDAALSGYQLKSPDRVLKTIGAIFSALHRLGLTYVSPPASFEQQGQKIRLPHRILESRMGTCLDLAVLMAACLEQAGLHPLLILTQGHAFVGAWLVEECFPACAEFDIAALRKRVDLGEVCVAEATLLANPEGTFERARAEARSRLECDETFQCAIDVHRARASQIRPLPLKAEGQTVRIAIGERRPRGDQAEAAPEYAGSTDRIRVDECGPNADDTPATRLDRWKRKLLDLTLHNRLINFKDSKKSLPILCPDTAALEDALADGREFTIGPRPAEMENSPRDAQAHMQRTGNDLLKALLAEEFQARRLHADLTPADLANRLVEIFRASRGAIEESGFNPLYLAIGFLQWHESAASDQPRLAPIILIPLELARRLVREGFRIRQGDDDPMINITLLEMLERDFGIRIEGLDPLPQDEHGIDVAHILTVIRRAVLHVPRWDVLDHAQIGLFTFTKHLMWRDLQARSGDLLQNRLVDHLVNRPNDPFPGDGDFPDKDRLDETHRLAATYSPLSADSSQMAAVYAAAEGKTFVLEGPPGTGKSQTITNLIAQALTAGKSVLFVSEKMAALDVVFSRLKRIGLERFCLALHSNKSHKKDVIDQLGQSLELVHLREPEEWDSEAARLEEMRRDLNRYPEAMHRKRGTGQSVYEGLSRLIGLRGAPEIQLAWNSPDDIDREKLRELREWVDKVSNAGAACGHPSGHAWAASRREEWSHALSREVQAAIDELKGKLPALETAAAAAGPHLDVRGVAISLDGFGLLGEMASLLMSSPGPTAALLTGADWDETEHALGEWIRRGRLRDSLREKLYGRYTEAILALDLEALAARLERAGAAWGPIGWFKRLPVGGALKKAARAGHKPAAGQLADDLKDAIALRAEEDALNKAGDRARGLLGRFWQDGRPDWDALEKLTAWAGTFRKLTAAAGGGNLDKAAQYRQHLARLLTEGREQLAPAGAIGRALTDYLRAWVHFQDARHGLEQLLALDAEAAWGAASEPNAAARIARRLESWLADLPELQGWCNWRATRHGAIDRNLLNLVEAYEGRPLESKRLRAAFDRAFYQWWVESHFAADPVLKAFYSPEHERKIQAFRKMDEEFLRLTIELVQARLAAKVPVNADLANENSEMGILQRQLQRQRNHMAIRKLFQKIPHLLPLLKPCLLMSPISVAQYLDPSHPPFDLIVFDEASQIPVWDAVGAIARGRDAVIVGDPKQLPPTNFFNRADAETPDDDDAVEDLESILDDCIGARIPRLRLSWHYRSRHESLIAFSNYNYYENRLLTFPSPANGVTGVQWRPVPHGIYDAGRSRTNRAEADAVVSEIIRRLADPELSRWSIGVVTFSSSQQELIEDLLDKAQQDRPEIESFFNSDAPEHVFVKNLESVQGDERDVILFSICYGPDAQGRVSMNFGPLNKDGGERRLNVAITRARREVVVFSTLRADQIDLSRTRSRGAADLKLFLKYAEQGPSAIAEATSPSHGGSFDSPFERQVHDALTARGHAVHAQVGCSGYRIDLAVVDPAAPGRYLIGIECDGANYHRARTARDRDRLREIVLRDLGWQLHRVWSTDWWNDPNKTLEKIEAAIEKAKLAPVPRDPPPPPRTGAAPQPAADPARPEPSPPPEAGLAVYEVFKADEKLGDNSDFHSRANDDEIRERLGEIVEKEGPISLGLAARRLGESYGIGRVTERTMARTEQVARRAHVQVESRDGSLFLWPPGGRPEDYADFRVPGESADSRRDAADLPPEEIANAAHYILKRQISLPADDLVKETARLFGYLRAGAQVDQAIRRGIQLLVARNRAHDREGMVILAR